MVFQKTVLALFAVLAVTGCKPISEAFNRTFYKGTVQGVVKCVELSSNDLVSEQTTRAACTDEFEKNVGTRIIGGNASLNLRGTSLQISGRLENESDNVVITQANLVYVFVDADGKEHSASGKTILWLEPQNSVSFSSDLLTDDLNGFEEWPEKINCSKQTNETKRDCTYWKIPNVWGVTLH